MNRREVLWRGAACAGSAMALGLGLTGQAAAQSADGPSALTRVRDRGRLVVGVYNEMPPFHDKGSGIDVELAASLAKALGVQVSLLPFTADENMNDDLRNMVWKGHYLGYGPADVLLHVPVDPPLMNDNPQVQIFGPYWRETVAIARDLSKVPTLESFSQLGGQRIAVPGMSLAGWLMIGADGGALRERLVTKLPHGVAAAQMLKDGEVAAAAGMRSELESALHDDPRFAITPLPSPRAPRNGWAVGMAVKRNATDLARALQGAINDLGTQGELKRLFAQSGVAWRPV